MALGAEHGLPAHVNVDGDKLAELQIKDEVLAAKPETHTAVQSKPGFPRSREQDGGS